MFVLKIILFIFNILLGIGAFHFVLFALYPLFKKEKKLKKFKPKTRYMILIAARNEEMVIGNLIDSIKEQNYPKDKFKICVLPNNCSDKTKEVSEEHGAMILEPTSKVKSKGEVLNFAYSYFSKDDSFDTYLILDADNVLHPDFLKNMNQELLNGWEVVQGFRDSKNLYDNHITGSYSLFFYLQNYFLNKPRNNLLSSANINGTGYAFKKDVLKKINYHAKTLTEDIEFTTSCAIHRVLIGYSLESVFYDEQVNTFKDSIKQRRRWVQGTLQVLRKYYKEIFLAMKEKNSLSLMDVFYILTTPITQALSFLLGIISFIFFMDIRFLWLIIIVVFLLHVFLSIFLFKVYKKDVKRLLTSLLFFPIFNISWAPICIYALFRTNTKWESIKHTKKINIQDILKGE